MTTVGRRERGKQRRRDQILDAAAELIREQPERVPRVNEIADRADVAPATVFNLVGTRADLWSALINRAVVDIVEDLDEDGDPRTTIEALMHDMMGALCADPEVHRAALAHWSESGRLLRNDAPRTIARLLRAAQTSGGLGAHLDPDEMAALIATTCTGAAHQWAAGLLDDATLEQRCMAIVELVFAAG